MSTQKPIEWVSSLITRFEEQVCFEFIFDFIIDLMM